MSASSEAGGQRAARTDHGALSGSAAPDGVSAARLDQQPEQGFARLRRRSA